MAYQAQFSISIDPAYPELSWEGNTVTQEVIEIFNLHVTNGDIQGMTTEIDPNNPLHRIRTILYKDNEVRTLIKNKIDQLPNRGILPGFVLGPVTETEL
jgi:hypothetical protein